MILEIKEIKQCRNRAYGNYMIRGKDKAVITISRKLNTPLAEYMSTLLHELLHCWFTMSRKKGFRVTDKNEHKMIYAVEDVIIAIMKQHLKKKGKKNG